MAFSLAGEHRDLVRPVAELVEKKLGSPNVFFDDWFEYYIAGDDGDLKLQKIYEECRLAVVCVSGQYGNKPWTRVEHAAIRARLMKSRSYAEDRDPLGIIPIRVGEGDVEGILFNTIVPDIRGRSATYAAELILNRLQLTPRLEEIGRQPEAEPARIKKERLSGAKPAPTGIFSKLPVWARVLVVLAGIFVVGSSLYWSLRWVTRARYSPVGSWTTQNSGTGEFLNAVTFITPQSGWAVGGKGIFLFTEDGGGTWKQSHDLVSRYEVPWAVAFATRYSGWAVGYAGVILHTEDGGGTWVRQNSGTVEWLASVAFATPQSGWAVGEGGTILHTEDGGDSWKSQTSGTSEILHSVVFSNLQSGWVVGRGGIILHTEDGGDSWKAQSSGTSENLNSVTFVMPKLGWAVGERGSILHTEDGGRSWGLQKSTPDNVFTSVAFVTPQSGWVVGGGGVILHTENGGVSWKQQGSGTDQHLSSVVFVTPKLGWAVGDKGTILHYQR